MVGKVQKQVVKHLKPKVLNKYIKKKEKDADVLRKLYFIKKLYKGEKIADACKEMEISLPTGHNWLDRWNEEGYIGLFPKYYNGGRPSKLSDADKENLDKILEKEEYLTSKMALEIIKKEFDVDYSASSLSVLLRSLGYHYTKPYQYYSKRPSDAEEQLKKKRVI
jgi:putative transposase